MTRGKGVTMTRGKGLRMTETKGPVVSRNDRKEGCLTMTGVY